MTMTDAAMPQSGTAPLVSVSGLTKRFPVGRNLFRRASGFIHAVDDVSFALEPGESLGLVGESGCGKTTVGKLLVKLLEPTDGEIRFRLPGLSAESSAVGSQGVDLTAADFQVDSAAIAGKQLRVFRRQAQMIFQGPLRVYEPPAHHLRHHRRTPGRAGHRHGAGPGGPGFRNPDAGGPDAPGHLPLPPSPRAFRRPATAGRHRPRPGGRAVLRGGRRADPPCWTYPAAPGL